MYTTPPCTTGEESLGAPRLARHAGWHSACPQPSASKTYRWPSYEATYAESAVTAGEDSRPLEVPATPFHSGWHMDPPQPSTLNTSSLPSLLLTEVCESM